VSRKSVGARHLFAKRVDSPKEKEYTSSINSEEEVEDGKGKRRPVARTKRKDSDGYEGMAANASQGNASRD
jgi:hypothetical protein